MEILSEKAIDLIDNLHTERLDYTGEYLPLIEAAQRLADYENTGLTPEEVEEFRMIFNEISSQSYGPIHQKIADWLMAEKDGRLVVLPCKVGDTVYFIFEGNVHDVQIQGIPLGRNNELILSFGGCPVQYVWGSEIGKTVFLTREEAEAALARGGNEDG